MHSPPPNLSLLPMAGGRCLLALFAERLRELGFAAAGRSEPEHAAGPIADCDIALAPHRDDFVEAGSEGIGWNRSKRRGSTCRGSGGCVH